MSHEGHHHDLESQNTAGTTPNTYEPVSQATTQAHSHQPPANFQPFNEPPQHAHKHKGMNDTQKKLIVGFTVMMPIHVLTLEYFVIIFHDFIYDNIGNVVVDGTDKGKSI